MEENILIPFPSDYDAKLKISSLNPETKIMVVIGSEREMSYSEALDCIWNLPQSISKEATPNGVDRILISRNAKKKLVYQMSNLYNAVRFAYIQAVPHIEELVYNSLLLEEHRDRMKNEEGERLLENYSDRNIEKIQRLYGAFQYNSQLYRVKTTIQVFKEAQGTSIHHGYDITEIELLNPKTATPKEGRLQPLNNNPISLAKLLNNVELSYEPNVKLLDAMIACHEFAITGNYAKMISVYETARQKRLSTHLVDPLQAIRQAKTVRQTHIMPPTERTKALLQPKPKQNAVRKENKGMKL